MTPNPLAYRSLTPRPDMKNDLPYAIVRVQEGTQVPCVSEKDTMNRCQVYLVSIGPDVPSPFWAFKEKEQGKGSPKSHRTKLKDRPRFGEEQPKRLFCLFWFCFCFFGWLFFGWLVDQLVLMGRLCYIVLAGLKFTVLLP